MHRLCASCILSVFHVYILSVFHVYILLVFHIHFQYFSTGVLIIGPVSISVCFLFPSSRCASPVLSIFLPNIHSAVAPTMFKYCMYAAHQNILQCMWVCSVCCCYKKVFMKRFLRIFCVGTVAYPTHGNSKWINVNITIGYKLKLSKRICIFEA